MISCIDTSPIADGLFDDSGWLDRFLQKPSRFSNLAIADAAVGDCCTDDGDGISFCSRRNNWRAFDPKKGFRDASSNWEEMMFSDLEVEPIQTDSEPSRTLARRLKNMVQGVFS